MPTIKSLYRGMFKLYRWPLLILVALFGLGILLGAVLPANLKLMVLEAVLEKFATIIGDADTAWELSQHIFINNFLVSLLLYGLGFTIFFPALMIVVNGVVIGLFLELMHRLNTIVPGMFWSSLVSLLPHGVFELSAFFLSGSLSIMVVLKAIFTKIIEPTKLRRQVLLESVIRFCTIVVPLLMIAGLLEGFVSPRVGTAVSTWIYRQHQTAALAITPAPAFLSQHHCTVLSEADTKQSLGTDQTNDMLSLAQAVYDPAIYQLLQQRSTVPSWEHYYTCDNDLTIGLKSYPAEQWSVAMATQLQTLFQTKQTNNTSSITVRRINTTTVVIVLSNNTVTIDDVLKQ